MSDACAPPGPLPKRVRALQHVGSILPQSHGGLSVSKQMIRKTAAIELVLEKRDSGNQTLGFASRPFVLCGLPIKRPRNGVLLHERRNGQFLLQVTGHPTYGLPWGQDRLVPIFLATLAIRQQQRTITFRSALEMLDTFGMQQGGFPVPTADWRLPTHFWRDDLLRLGHARREGGGCASRPVQFHE